MLIFKGVWGKITPYKKSIFLVSLSRGFVPIFKLFQRFFEEVGQGNAQFSGIFQD
jgi:hypothetical protein